MSTFVCNLRSKINVDFLLCSLSLVSLYALIVSSVLRGSSSWMISLTSMNSSLVCLAWIYSIDRLVGSTLSFLVDWDDTSLKLAPSIRGAIIVKNWMIFSWRFGICTMNVCISSCVASYLLNSIFWMECYEVVLLEPSPFRMLLWNWALMFFVDEVLYWEGAAVPAFGAVTLYISVMALSMLGFGFYRGF